LFPYVRFEHPGYTYRAFGFIFSEPGCDRVARVHVRAIEIAGEDLPTIF
jgi:hypothetical protein